MSNSQGSFEEVAAVDLLNELNESDEHGRLEAKRSQKIGTSILETVCAFSNEPGLDGGYILLGIDRATSTLWPAYAAVGVTDPDALQNDLSSQCRTLFNRPVRPRLKVERIGRKTVIVVKIDEVPASEKPIFLSRDGLPRGAFRRIGSADHRCTAEDLIVFARDQVDGTYDESVVEDATMEDIDETAVALYRSERGRIKADAEELQSSDEDLLLALSCARNTREGLKPTVAGILLFGTRLALRRIFPMMRIDYICKRR